ncbi:MAG: hypothetical protein ACKVWV_06660 [Planctomycetota bacterium]
MNLRSNGRRASDERGSVIVVTMIAVAGLAGLSLALLAVMRTGANAQRRDRADAHVHYVCHAGLSEAVYNLHRGASGNVGTQGTPIEWGASQYWVTQSAPAADLVQLTAFGMDDRSGASMELVLRAVPNTIWRYAAFGDEFLHMDSNARVDSYDSSLGAYAAQAVNGSGSSQHANADGDIGSNGDVSMDQNSTVWGDATAGPGHTTTVLGNAAVTGTTSPAAALIDLPLITVPSYTGFGALTVTGTTTIPSGNRTYTNLVVNANKTLNIVGPANIVFTNLRIRSNGVLNIDSTNGPVEIWVIDDFILDSNAMVGPLDQIPSGLKVNLLSDNVINPEVAVDIDTVDFNSNTQMYGTIYAPNAQIEIDSNFQLFGAMIARSVDLDSNSRIHFDEALISATSVGAPTYETIAWRELPFRGSILGGAP